MGTYERCGHFRSNRHGKVFWVNATIVNRIDVTNQQPTRSEQVGGRFPNPTAPSESAFFDQYPEFKHAPRASFRLLVPNAKCPVCNQSVFYYRNEHGSSVFFDEIGPPWPKHPCTTKSDMLTTNFKPDDLSQIHVRTCAAMDDIFKWEISQRNNFDLHTTPCGADLWPLAQLVRRFRKGKRVFAYAKLIGNGKDKLIFFSCEKLPGKCKHGCLISVFRRRISLIDPVTLEPLYIDIIKYRSALAFLLAADTTAKEV